MQVKEGKKKYLLPWTDVRCPTTNKPLNYFFGIFGIKTFWSSHRTFACLKFLTISFFFFLLIESSRLISKKCAYISIGVLKNFERP